DFHQQTAMKIFGASSGRDPHDLRSIAKMESWVPSRATRQGPATGGAARRANRREAGPVKFLCDHMLGTLAKWLRFLGNDVAYPGPVDDNELIALAGREDRTLLTRDRELSERMAGSLFVASDDLDAQL